LDTSRIIGARPGIRIDVGGKKLLAIRPDAKDHAQNIRRGAQIIIPKDGAQIVFGLGIGPGSKVIEGGAGSGGLTLLLLNAVAPDGLVTTYDIRQDHLDLTSANVSQAGLSAQWVPRTGDVSEDVGERDQDAFVVDVPEPEKCLEEVKKALRPGGRFCAYVPTTNQMERVVLGLEEKGFRFIEPMEVLLRPYTVKEGATRPVNEMLSHTGFLIFARWLGSP
jgi:tRNA (adenine57-N1/adenine58-N1)-methyltransferase